MAQYIALFIENGKLTNVLAKHRVAECISQAFPNGLMDNRQLERLDLEHALTGTSGLLIKNLKFTESSEFSCQN